MTIKIGIISDTHMPLRWDRLHDCLPGIFSGVDLIFHAGDVGELWVLDELGRIAPVVAVQGNDETDAVIDALPFHQVMMICGHRIVLNHGARRDPVEEMEIRKDDRWISKLDYLAGYTHQFGADIIVTGHLHIPMFFQHDGVWIVNPGAVASGGGMVRQVVQTVAKMTLELDQPPQVVYHDLNADGAIRLPHQNFENNLQPAFALYSEPIMSPELRAVFDKWIKILAPQSRADWHSMTEAIRPVLMPRWRGELPSLTIEFFVEAVHSLPDPSPILVDGLRRIPEFALYFDS